MDKAHMLYVLAKIVSVCRGEHAVYHTTAGTEDHAACLALEADGTIRRVPVDDGDHFMWEAT